MLNKSDESGRPCLVLGLRGKLSIFFVTEYDVSFGLSWMAFISLRYAHLIPRL